MMAVPSKRRPGREASAVSAPRPRVVHRGRAPKPVGVAPPHGARTCVGCGREGARGELVRIVFGPDGELAIDSGEGAFGRGAHVHAVLECVQSAGQKGLARRARPPRGAGAEAGPVRLSLGGEALSAGVLRGAIAAAYRRRLAGLFAAARRARAVEIGADAACAAVAAGRAAAIVVAVDAAAAADRSEVRAAIALGRAVAFGTKLELGDLLGSGREEGVAVAAILDDRIAAAVRDAVHVVDGLSSGAPEASLVSVVERGA